MKRQIKRRSGGSSVYVPAAKPAKEADAKPEKSGRGKARETTVEASADSSGGNEE